ncbi:MAG: hypothetical protein OXG36_05785 [Caldilineaceae bacterium]|nr:hypothetical protein [Caldilineaceae bacterium]
MKIDAWRRQPATGGTWARGPNASAELPNLPFRDYARMLLVRIRRQYGPSILNGAFEPTVSHDTNAACIEVLQNLFAVANPIDLMRVEHGKQMIPAQPIVRPTGEAERQCELPVSIQKCWMI